MLYEIYHDEVKNSDLVVNALKTPVEIKCILSLLKKTQKAESEELTPFMRVDRGARNSLPHLEEVKQI